jgi:DNA polymerase
MHEVRLEHAADLQGFRTAARPLLLACIPAAEVAWRVGEEASDLLASSAPLPSAAGELRLPRRFLELAGAVICHASNGRFALLYRLAARLADGERDLLERPADPDVAETARMAKAVSREEHRMHAFVRFREVVVPDGTWSVAWFEPQHHVLERAAPFFVRRFASLRWSILTPNRSAHWDGSELRFAPGAERRQAPPEDALDDIWRTYYASIFNPARLNPMLMRRHMPKRYWPDLPESRAIPRLVRSAGSRTDAMLQRAVPPERGPLRVHAAARADGGPSGERPRTPAELNRALQACRACPLHAAATRAVGGEGPTPATVMFVGEQPGDQEDLAGRPFVGPAGRLFDRALGELGIDRGAVYVTNAVKHFKYEPRGKRRLHRNPDAGEIDICRSWLDAERELVAPALTVALGASAARAVLGRTVRIGAERGRIVEMGGARAVLVTVHPAAILRQAPGEAEPAYRRWLEDLRLVLPFLASPAAA